MSRHWKIYAVWILLVELVGAIASLLTRAGVERYEQMAQKPPLTPPGMVFGIVWAVLFALMGIGAARIWMNPKSAKRTKALQIFFAQLFVNVLWTIIFFNLEMYVFSFLVLLVLLWLIYSMIRAFNKVDPLAAKLQIPYFLWVIFAGYLNVGVWMINR